MQNIEPEVRRTPGAPDLTYASAVRRPVWKRTHIIWFLIALSLAPGLAAAAFREEWAALPAGVRMTAYVVSGILIVASCTLMLREDAGPPAPHAEGDASGDSP